VPKTCSQCGKPAIFEMQGHLLCLDCGERLERIQMGEFMRTAAAHNQLAASLENQLPFRVPRINIPSQAHNIGSTTFNSVKIDRSTVGNVNTGTIRQLGDSIATIGQTNTEFSSKVQSFANELLVDQTLSAESKQEAIEILATITDDIKQEKINQRPRQRRSLIERMKSILEPAANLATIFATIATQLQA